MWIILFVLALIYKGGYGHIPSIDWGYIKFIIYSAVYAVFEKHIKNLGWEPLLSWWIFYCWFIFVFIINNKRSNRSWNDENIKLLNFMDFCKIYSNFLKSEFF